MSRRIPFHLLLLLAIAPTCEGPAGTASPPAAMAPLPLDSLQCSVVPRCTTTQLDIPTGRRADSEFSSDGASVYERGIRTNFDPSSFSAWRAADCQLWLDTFARDVRDVYVRQPASCGGENCASPDYTGFYWKPLSVQDPASFVLLNAGYGRDSKRVYYQRGPQPVLSGADAATFQVLWCGKAGDDPDGEIVGRDSTRYYLDGVPVDPARVEERWARRRSESRR